MILMEELNPHRLRLTTEQQENLLVLLKRVNDLRTAYGKPMFVTSGLRSVADHLKIYMRKGIPINRVPMKSQHLVGAACDFSDPKGDLARWAIANEKKLELFKLWCEAPGSTPGWLHVQIFPPKSGKRFFRP